jgi:hypothetical protein
MPIVFFEGFNNSNTDLPKLDSKYWSTNNLSNISYAAGRTNNCLNITNRPVASGTGLNTTLTLSNFTDPLLSNNCFGLGFYNGGAIITETGTAPANAKFLTFYRSGVPVLDLDFIKTTYSGNNSVGIQVRQNGTGVTTYDFYSVDGASWLSNYYIDYGGSQVNAINGSYYFEIFVDPKSLNRMLIRVSDDSGTKLGLLKNSSGNNFTSISGFTNLTSIRFYSRNDAVATWGLGGTESTIDDLYLSGSGNADTTLVGPETYIARIQPDEDTAINGWVSKDATAPYTALTTADNDSSYVYADLTVSGTQSLYSFTNVDVNLPTGLILVKSINVARKTSIETNGKFINIMRTGAAGTITELGSSYTISGLDYGIYSNIIYNNPVTGSGWKLSEIQNMQVGMKTQGTGV